MAISNQEAQYQLWALSQDTDSTAEADEARLIGLAIDGIDEITTGLLDRAAEDTSTFVYQSRFRYTGLPADIATDALRRLQSAARDEKRIFREYRYLLGARQDIQDGTAEPDLVMHYALTRLDQLEAAAKDTSES